MGKPTGFLEYQRQANPAEDPQARIRHYQEFHPRLDREERRRQGGRCMECGVPFCQSGAVLGGMVSGCYPLDDFYKSRPECECVKEIKRKFREG